MKTFIILFALIFSGIQIKAQSCNEILRYVKQKSTGTTYFSPSSSAISKVTFYELTVDYQKSHFAVVTFTSNYYKEYIYMVGSNTRMNYSFEYLNSAGKAFWKYIEPYNKNLECAPSFN